MKTEKIKVGQSFDVVKVLNSNYSWDLFKIGGHTIMINNRTLTNGYGSENINISIGSYNQHTAKLFGAWVKQIGKLTITKLK